MIKKEFDFLAKLYDFDIYFEQKSGSYCFAAWANSKNKIKVLYDITDKAPIRILTYDADSLGTIYDITEYKNEFVTDAKKSREKIHCTAEWLKNAIINEVIVI